MVKKTSLFLVCSLVIVVPAYASEIEGIPPVSIYWSLPFIALLLSIAILPLIAKEWWDKHYPIFAISLGLIVAFYYLTFNAQRFLQYMVEYISFISLIGSLFIVSGGILIRSSRKATPLVNALILLIGAIIANLFGTTGASMLLIRPFIRINRYRIRPYHIVFFIFLVSNIGGCLTPIGDPPLFLGYLKGVPFFWFVKELLSVWALEVVIVIAIFFIIDLFHYSRLREEKVPKIPVHFEMRGLKNLIFIVLILLAVFLHTPAREIIMVVAAIASYMFTPKEVHDENEFKFHPITEVAILFLGIFSTMVPALDWLELNAKVLGITSPLVFFWATGIFSSFLDNAPTFLTFLSTAVGLTGLEVKTLLLHNPLFIKAIAAGAVFFGANTYIGNGPNFMVKSIAEHSHVKVPHFAEYIYIYSLPILVPTFILISVVFF